MADGNALATQFGNIAKAGALGGGLAGLGLGLFGNPSGPYEDASAELSKYLPEAKGYQQPYYEAGTGAIPQFQDWLGQMKDPSGFVNKLMGGYQQSPWAQYQTDQMMKSAENAASASGLTGSTPMAKFVENQAGKISSGDMQNWLQNVLGINRQYGAGVGGLMQGGQNAANSLSNMLGNYASAQANLKYGAGAAEEGGLGNIMGGLGQLAMFAML